MITDIAEQHTQKKNDKFDVNNGNVVGIRLDMWTNSPYGYILYGKNCFSVKLSKFVQKFSYFHVHFYNFKVN